VRSLTEYDKSELQASIYKADVLLVICENTKQYPFKSRQRLAAGEVGLAMAGVIRFVNGNLQFKSKLSIDQLTFIDEMTDLMQSVVKLNPYEWNESRNDL
jgi:hypothetical protein